MRLNEALTFTNASIAFNEGALRLTFRRQPLFWHARHSRHTFAFGIFSVAGRRFAKGRETVGQRRKLRKFTMTCAKAPPYFVRTKHVCALDVQKLLFVEFATALLLFPSLCTSPLEALGVTNQCAQCLNMEKSERAKIRASIVKTKRNLQCPRVWEA